jgi:hypothetical protein
LKIDRILHKIQLQAEEASRELRQREREKAAHPTVTQHMRINQGYSMIRNLRKRTDDIKLELEVRKRLKAKEEKYLKAAMELREANLTAAERQARKDEARRGQLQLSRVVCRELSPDWRSDATAEFKKKRL